MHVNKYWSYYDVGYLIKGNSQASSPMMGYSRPCRTKCSFENRNQKILFLEHFLDDLRIETKKGWISRDQVRLRVIRLD